MSQPKGTTDLELSTISPGCAVELPEAWASPVSANDHRPSQPASSARGRAIRSVQYDDAARVMTIQWASGNVYAFDDVPPSVHEALLAAPSKGKYFQDRIRAQYQARRLH